MVRIRLPQPLKKIILYNLFFYLFYKNVLLLYIVKTQFNLNKSRSVFYCNEFAIVQFYGNALSEILDENETNIFDDKLCQEFIAKIIKD